VCEGSLDFGERNIASTGEVALVEFIGRRRPCRNPLRPSFHTVCLNFGAPVKPAKSRE
jgi:hypothetical protein